METIDMSEMYECCYCGEVVQPPEKIFDVDFEIAESDQRISFRLACRECAKQREGAGIGVDAIVCDRARKLVIDPKKVVEAIFKTYDEPAPNGQYQINIFLGIHKPGETGEYAPEFLQSGSYLVPDANVCEIGIMSLIQEDEFYCDSIRGLMDFSQARSDGREEAAYQGLLNLESDDLPSDEAQKIIDGYEDQAISYAREVLEAIRVESLGVDRIAFVVEWREEPEQSD
jgi:hypothetical protein